MEFEELQHSWQTQPLSIPDNTQEVREGIAEKWRKQQRAAIWSNIGVTIGLGIACCVMVWIYFSFKQGRSPFFGGSLATMIVLMLVFIRILWKGVVLKKHNPSLPGKQYASRYLKALYLRRRALTTYTWVYSSLLWLSLICYFYDVLQDASLTMQIIAPVATTIYMLAIQLVIRKKTSKKQLRKLDDLIADLNKIYADESE